MRNRYLNPNFFLVPMSPNASPRIREFKPQTPKPINLPKMDILHGTPINHLLHIQDKIPPHPPPTNHSPPSTCPISFPLSPPIFPLFSLPTPSLSPFISYPPSPSSLSNKLPMASTTTTSSLNSLHQAFTPHHHHNPLSPPRLSLNLSSSSSSSSLSLTSTTTFSLLTPTTSSTTSSSSFDELARHLAAADYREADEETRRLLIALAGDSAKKRGYVFFSEVQFIDPSDLRAIDNLWLTHSDGRFGYSVQKRIWEKKAKRDFTRFFIRVGWMRKLDTEVEQWNYRSFPTEFIWELKDDTPEGHLPLTNALRGTQLLASILTHPAFAEEGEEEGEESDGEEMKKEKPKLMGGNRTLQTDYSF